MGSIPDVHVRRLFMRSGTSFLALALAGAMASAAQAQAVVGPATNPVPEDPSPLVNERGIDTAATGEPIVVTGSRIARSGFDAPTPLTLVGQEQIARQGASNIAQVLNDIPAFRPQATAATTAIFMNNIGASSADLRGLGANRTLVLIDGRRVVPATVSGSGFAPANTVDLNMIPTSLVERVEVVTGGASAAYGSDAVAGVVNLIIDTNLEGIRGQVQYGLAEEGDDEELVLSLAGGSGFADGRGRFVMGVELVDDKGTGNCYSRDWCALSYNTVSNPVVNPARPELGRVSAGDPATLILPNTRVATATFNGQIIGGPLRGIEFNPDGTIFRHDYGTYFGAGIFQSGGGDPQLAFYQWYPISSPSRRVNSFAHAEYDVSDALTVFAEGSYGRVEASTLGAQRRDLAPRIITRDNAFLPTAVAAGMDQFGLPVIPVARIWNDIGPQRGQVERATYRGVVGAKGDVWRDWTFDAYYQFGRTDYSQLGFNTTINSRMNFAIDAVRDPVTGAPVCRAVLNGNPAAAGCEPLNIFGAGSPSQAAIDYVTGTVMQTTELTQHVASAAVQGEVVDLWAGPLAVATGIEYRKDIAEGTADPISRALDFYTGPGSPIDGQVEVWEGFAEAVLPLTSTAELNGAVRLTDYSTSGSVTTWKVGADWAPFDWVRLRATRSRDIRAPNIFELFGPTQTSFQSILDPQTGAQVLSSVLLAGNADLQAEVADTWTAGVVLQPRIGPGAFRLSVDYYDIELEGAVSTLGAQVIVDRCFEGATDLCSFVDRDASGTISTVRNYNLNLNTLITRGWDIEAYYSLPLSSIWSNSDDNVSLRVLSTIVDDLTTVDSSGVAVDRANMVGSPVSQPSGVPRYIINGYVTYSSEPFEAQVQVRHISGGRYNTSLIGPDEEGYDPLLPNSINDNSVGAWTYVNLNASYDLWRDADRSLQLYGVVSNLFDKDPPVNIPSSFGPTNNVLYDVVGRTYRIGVRVRY
ncbi:TonB-dependent receptor domain-containing protein [Altericroceibacterium xinjiangense]|uniref:TonB-dependent receptor domain-containing protein n=1 Tax=Altericroceibacterium xinjiangense TaxID=762261 RepID=UPI0013DF380E|nr:TonB-dependent receptor [Altericroceibacterium xinjiangense]